MNNIVRTESFTSKIMEVDIGVTVSIARDYTTAIDFTCFRTPYTFQIQKWRSRGLANFLQLFFAYGDRDVGEFGSILYTPDGLPDFTSLTVTHKQNAVIRACKDIMICLDIICAKYQRSVLDYAVWYRENCKKDDTYNDYITLRTCHSIVHTNFLAPNMHWDIIGFPLPV